MGKRKPTARMEQNDSRRDMNLNLSQAISEVDDTSAIETRGATNGRPEEQSDLQQQQQLRRLSLLELGATMRQDGEEVTSLCNQLRESNTRAKLQSDKVERINAIRRKISKVTNKASEDYEHFLKMVEENRDMDQEEMRNCVTCLKHMRDNLLRRIYSVAHEFETETLPPLKNAIFSAFAEARANIDAIGQRVDAMMMRDEQRRKEILERRIEAACRETETLRRDTAEAQARSDSLRRAAMEAQSRAREAAENARQARHNLNQAIASLLQRLLLSGDPRSAFQGLMTVLPEITEFLAVGNHSSSMPSVEPSPTDQEIGGGGNGETNDRPIEGMLLMAAIFSNMCARKKPKKAKETTFPEEATISVAALGTTTSPEGVTASIKDQTQNEATETNSSPEVMDITNRVEQNWYPRPENGPLDERLRKAYSVIARLADDFQAEIRSDVEYLQQG